MAYDVVHKIPTNNNVGKFGLISELMDIQKACIASGRKTNSRISSVMRLSEHISMQASVCFSSCWAVCGLLVLVPTKGTNRSETGSIYMTFIIAYLEIRISVLNSPRAEVQGVAKVLRRPSPGKT
jgi:hypothetical protein